MFSKRSFLCLFYDQLFSQNTQFVSGFIQDLIVLMALFYLIRRLFWMMQPLPHFLAILKSIFIQIFHFWNHLAFWCRQSYRKWQHWNSLPTSLCPRKEKSFGTSEPKTFCTASSCSICYPLHCYVILWLLTGPYVNYFALNSLRDVILI